MKDFILRLILAISGIFLNSYMFLLTLKINNINSALFLTAIILFAVDLIVLLMKEFE